MTKLVTSLEAIKGIKPESVWKHFYSLTQVPRPSKHEEKIQKFMCDFAEANKWEYKKDKAGNIVIKVPASHEEYKNAPTVCLQGHLDMVCEANRDHKIDFLNDPITIQRDGDWIKAVGTSLGADNGIGVAMAMAIATDKPPHGPLELLFTSDEETGMTGAFEILEDFISAKYMINIDSEEIDTIYVGCAGGIDTVAVFDIEYQKVENAQSKKPYELLLTGLKGGHSGCDIHIGRANAIKLMGFLLRRLISKFGVEVASLTGGSKRNAIPRESQSIILVPENADVKQIQQEIDQFVNDALLEYKKNDGGLRVEFKETDAVESVFTPAFTQKVLDVIAALPHGVHAMSPDMPELTETSTNFASIKLIDNGKLEFCTSQRSFIDNAKMQKMMQVKAVFDLAGAKVTVGDGYPGWKPNLETKILKIVKEAFVKTFNEEPKVKAIHAGLECGLLGAKFKDCEMISIGPTIVGAHSPDEKVFIPDVEKSYNMLKNILAIIAEQK